MTHRILTILSLVMIAASCNMNSPEMAKRQIQKLEGQAKEINEKIAALEAGMTVDSTEDVKFRIPVSVKEVKPETFSHFIDVTGILEAEEDAFISPEMNGQIEIIHVKEGQSVNKGQLLISLNTSVIESNILEVKTGLELANKLFEKQEELWEQSIGSELQYLEAKSAKEQAEARLATLEAQLEMARVKAPFSGIVETIMAKEGELAVPGMQVLQLVSLDNLKLYGNISERYMMSVKKGDPLMVSFPDIGNLTVEAPIFRVGNLIDNASRTFKIEVKIDNRKRKLKPNMYSIIRVNDFNSDKAFVVPSVAIKQDIKGNYTYVADTDNMKARKKYITTGLTYEDQTMVEEGLSEGDMVIVKGFAQVSDGMDIDLR